QPSLLHCFSIERPNVDERIFKVDVVPGELEHFGPSHSRVERQNQYGADVGTRSATGSQQPPFLFIRQHALTLFLVRQTYQRASGFEGVLDYPPLGLSRLQHSTQ